MCKLSGRFLDHCEASLTSYSELKEALIKICVGSKRNLTKEFASLLTNSQNLDVNEMEAKGWSVIDNIKKWSQLEEILIKYMVLIVSRLHLACN
ncbi:Uncharacterized protein FKW44_008046 [Caligus rogercresseyi]|uniref:Uncharacterized protein n=1 Tax=Caligus rogercresseyi TaxID=217165 RepID=A0A7T8KFR6_CALRO|nr:Uncharacterized protein FKW44_008046 [Caligus rogercresseyi]